MFVARLSSVLTHGSLFISPPLATQICSFGTIFSKLPSEKIVECCSHNTARLIWTLCFRDPDWFEWMSRPATIKGSTLCSYFGLFGPMKVTAKTRGETLDCFFEAVFSCRSLSENSGFLQNIPDKGCRFPKGLSKILLWSWKCAIFLPGPRQWKDKAVVWNLRCVSWRKTR